MSSFSRLWRRAPAWRACLVTAFAFTALAVMFPPVRPSWLPDHTAPATPHFVPQPDAAPPNDGQLDMPPPGAGRSGAIPFSGHHLPLPAGSWQDLVLAQAGGAMAMQVELLSRVENQHLTGIELAAAPSPLSADKGVAASAPCYATNVSARQIVQMASTNPLAHECWTLSAVAMSGDDMFSRTHEILHRGLDGLQQMGVDVPPHMLLFTYLRADETGWLTVLLLLPDRNEEQRRKLLAWLHKFAPLLHKGYESGLNSAEMTQLPRDPSPG